MAQAAPDHRCVVHEALCEGGGRRRPRALAEDVGAGDLTAGLVDPARRAQARVLARESAVICGAPWAEAALRQVDPEALHPLAGAEGERCAADQVVLEVEGSARALLTAERTALNFLQLLSAVATKTATYVEACAARARRSSTRARPCPACGWRRSTR
jgi:nicotinate-nucleotide pyrophosphorylase (carboxylating)